MTDDVLGAGPPPHREPALGTVVPRGPRYRIAVLTTMILAAAVLVVVRASGLLRDDATLPPLRAVAAVGSGLVRGAQPRDFELLRLRDDYGVRGLVAVGGASTEERATAQALHIPLVEVARGGPVPSAEDLGRLARFVRDVRPTDGGKGFVYLHDATGSGDVVLTTAMLQLLRGEDLTAVLNHLGPDVQATFSPAQFQALFAVDAAVRGDGDAAGSYASLTGATP